jgi:ABC-type nitrate/sulfonate/bicarbonate transport system permease component
MLISMPEMVEHGLAGEKVSRQATLLLKGGSILSFLPVWTLSSTVVAVYGFINPIFLPSPWSVFGRILDIALARQLEVHIAATFQRVIIGFGIASGLAVSLGLLAGRWRWLRNLLEPVIEVFRPIPPLALLPLFIVWVGIGEVSKIAFITYATFFRIFLTTTHGVLHVDPILARAAASLGASQSPQSFRVILPAVLPEILTGLRLGVAFILCYRDFRLHRCRAWPRTPD